MPSSLELVFQKTWAFLFVIYFVGYIIVGGVNMFIDGKYKRSFFMPPEVTMEWTKKQYIDKAPQWCSVDLRDGNQALVIPMDLEEKIEFFKFLVKIGFKEIEIGFPAASETEFEFTRKLIEDNLIPDDVTIQVLTQAREHIIRKTFEALKGCKRAIVHLYNATSVAHRELVFKKSKEEIKELAVNGAKYLVEYSKNIEGNFVFEYSPEGFTGTEMDYALEVCNAVIDEFNPTKDNKLIVNLPVTVENAMPHIYACQIEYMCKHINKRDCVIISLHPHNDRGCAVADTETGLLAGAQRVEGTLFGNGERTGNVDIVSLALNMFSQGVDPQLDFSDLPAIMNMYEKLTGMKINERQPYSGALVFAAFSGSHQDAIAKGVKYRKEHNEKIWDVPYLPLDPMDIGRQYEGDVIRINSQSGKGGIGYILEKNYGFVLPDKMREDFGYYIKEISDHTHKELMPEDIHKAFIDEYVNRTDRLKIVNSRYVEKTEIEASVIACYNGVTSVFVARGNGRFDAFSNAVKKVADFNYNLIKYQEHALEKSSTSQAVAYVGIELEDKRVVWGAGIHTDIITASVNALVSAINRSVK